MPDPVHIAAIDAGSNAIRLLVARADPSGRLEKLDRRRAAVRLGHRVFTHHEFDEETIAHAVQAFANFRHTMDKRRVRRYRAVATSATRNAYNRRVLIERILEHTGLELEVIDGVEEAALVRTAVIEALGPARVPRLIVDLGGGSLEVSLLRGDALERSMTLPVGTVRLLESFGLNGAMDEGQQRAVGDYVDAVLRDHLPRRNGPAEGLAVACGGNAETLAQIAPGKPVAGIHALNLEVLGEALPMLLAMDVGKRRKAYEVRRDRAEVMGIAAFVLVRLARWLGLREVLIPGVGVREGIIHEVARSGVGYRVQSGGPYRS